MVGPRVLFTIRDNARGARPVPEKCRHSGSAQGS